MSSRLIRVILNIRGDLADFISRSSKEKGVNKTTIINQALANERFRQEVQMSGRKIFIENEAGEKIQVIFK